MPPIFELIRERGGVSDEEMHEVFNMGCGFCAVVAAGDEEAALALLREHYPAAKRVGRAVDGAGEILPRLSGTPRRRAESLDGPPRPQYPQRSGCTAPQAR